MGDAALFPRNGNDLFTSLPLKDRLIFNSVIAFNRLTGRWRYPVKASGDLETMSKLDIIYWAYKCQFPVKHAWKNSDLEAFFEKQKNMPYALPADFKISSELSLSSVGDLMDHPFLPNSKDLYHPEVAELIFESDVSMANLECVIYTDSKPFVIKLPEAPPLYYRQENFDAIKQSHGRKYTFMATANNHSLDCKEIGVDSTLKALKKEGIAFHGTNENESDSYKAAIVEKKGFKLGMISHTFGLNAKKPPPDKLWIVNRTHLNGEKHEVDFSRIEKQVQFCKDSDVDLVIAHLHWGMENEYYPRPDQLDVAHHLAEMGVDIIVGHHPHVIQPLEHYRTKRDPNRIVPIYYSLGNLVNPFSDLEFRTGGVARLNLTKGIAKDGSVRTYVQSAKIHKIFQEIDTQSKKTHLVKAGD